MATRRRLSSEEALRVVRETASRRKASAPRKKRRATRSESTRRTVKKTKPAPPVRKSRRPIDPDEIKLKTAKTMADIEFYVGDLDKLYEEAQHDDSLFPKYKSRYGLPKSKEFTFREHDKNLSPLERRWLRIVDRYQAQLDDLYNALEHGIIGKKQHDQQYEILLTKLKKAQDNAEHAARTAERLAGRKPVPPRVPIKRKGPPPRKRASPRKKRP